MRSLVAEDELTSQKVLAAFLGKSGACDVVENGRAAVESVRAAIEDGHPYDLVCLDIMMPEMDGQEALRRIREVERDSPAPDTVRTRIIMTTSLFDVENVLQGIDEWDAYLVKPIDLAKMREQIMEFGLT